jgi:hypothetical protein|tara:strand:- start:415 stop:525 length:111 start_codon:yes stop_codon:yes gene_type:complete
MDRILNAKTFKISIQKITFAAVKKLIKTKPHECFSK